MAPRCFPSPGPDKRKLTLSLLIFVVATQPSAEGVALDAISFQLPAPPALTGNLATNNILLDAEQIHAGQIGTPHSFVSLGDNMYAVTDAGLVVNVAPCRPVAVANLRPRGCNTPKECGHLVSIRLSPDNLLVVLDAYRGVFEVHPVTGIVRQLYSSNTLVNGRASFYLNDLVFMKDGTLVLSDASPTFDYDNEFWIRFEGRPDGRLIGFNPTNGQSKEILAGVAYPTGLEITNDGKALIVCEAGRARMLRIELTKEKFFQRSFFSINLPGMPEHVRKSGRGSYLVGLSYPRYQGELSVLDQYSSKPVSRNFLAVRRTMEQLKLMYTKRGLGVELDENGKIVRSMHDPTGLKIAEVLELTEYSSVIYVGTRAQQATVRVVGSPNELTIDSLVQVLRGRCKVAEDRVQEAKTALQHQLKARKTMSIPVQGYVQGSPPEPPNGFNNMQPPVPQYTYYQANVSSSQPRYSVSLRQGLSQLHKTLLNNQSQLQKASQAYPQYLQGSPNYYQPAPPYQQQGQHPPPPNENYSTFQGRPVQDYQRPKVQNNPNPPTSYSDPFLPVNGPQRTIPLQRADRLPPSYNSKQTSPNQPHVVHSLHEGQLVSHVILGKKAEAALAGNLLSPKRTSPPPQQPTQAPFTNHPQPKPSPRTNEIATAATQNDFGALGGFMGFLDNTPTRNDAPVRAGDQVPRQDPNILISLPDQGLPRHLEPLHSIHPVPPPQGDHPNQGMNSLQSLAQFIGDMPSSQGEFRPDRRPINGSQGHLYQVTSDQFVSTAFRDTNKQHGMNVQDISGKEASAIQNMQMFHPTDRPDQLPQSQNYAGTKIRSSFQEKASLLKQGLQQIHRIYQQNKPNDKYFQEVAGEQQAPLRLDPRQSKQEQQTHSASLLRGSNPHSQSAYRNQASEPQQTRRTQVRFSDPSAETNQRLLPSHIYDRTTNVGNPDMTKQPLASFSAAATIHPNQPVNAAFDKGFSIVPAGTEDRQAAGIPATDFGSENLHSASSHTSASSQNSQNRTQHGAQSEQRPPDPPATSVSQAQILQSSLDTALPSSGYIQVYQGPGQYLLIPLSQSTLLQALSGLSPSDLQTAQIMNSRDQLSQPNLGNDRVAVSAQTPQESVPSNIKQGQGVVQSERQPNFFMNPQTQDYHPHRNLTLHQLPPQQQEQELKYQQQKGPFQQQQQQRQQQQQQLTSQLRNGQFYTSSSMYSETPNPVHSYDQIRETPIPRTQQEINSQKKVSNSFLTTSAHNTITPRPVWFTQNSERENIQPTQQFTLQDLDATNQKVARIPAQHLNGQSTHAMIKPAKALRHQYLTDQPTNLPTQQPAQRYAQQTSSEFRQPNERFIERSARQYYTQPTQHFTRRPMTKSARHFTQRPPLDTHLPQDMTFYSGQERPAQLSFQHFNQQPNQQYRHQQRGIQSAQSLKQHTQQSLNHSVWDKRPHFAEQSYQSSQVSNQQPTQQFPQQSNRRTSSQFNPNNEPATNMFTQQPNRQPSKSSNNQYTQNLIPRNSQQPYHQSSNQELQYSTQYPTQHYLQPLNNHPNQYLSQDITRQASQQYKYVPTQSFTQPTKKPLQLNNLPPSQRSVQLFPHQPTKVPIQRHSQATNQQTLQYNQQSSSFTSRPSEDVTIQNSPGPNQQATQQSSNQFIQQSSQQFTQQPQQLTLQGQQLTQEPIQTSSRMINYQPSNSTKIPSEQFSEQPNADFITQPAQQLSQQFNTQPAQGFTKQPVQQTENSGQWTLNPQSTQQFNTQPTQGFTKQPVQQLNPQQTENNGQWTLNPQSTQFNTQPTRGFTKKPNQQSIQQATQYNTQQVNQQLQQFNSSSTHFTQQPTRLSQLSDQGTDFTQETNPGFSTDLSNQQIIQYSTRQYSDNTNNHFTQSPTQQFSQQFSHQPTQHSTRQFTEQPSQQPTRQFTEQPSQQSTRQFTEQPSQQSTRQFIEQPSQQSTRQFIEQPSQQPARQFTEQPSQQPTRQFTEQPSQQSTRQFIEQPSQQPTRQFTEQPSQQPTRQFTEQPSQQPPRQFIEQPSQQSTRQFIEQPAQQSTRQFIEQPSQQPPRQFIEQPSQQSTRQFIEQPAQQSTRQFIEQPIPKPTTDPKQVTQKFTDIPYSHVTQQGSVRQQNEGINQHTI